MATITEVPARSQSISVELPPPLSELAHYKQWVVWSRATGNKQPLRAHDRRPASSTDPNDWCSFSEAVAACQADPSLDLEFILSSDDPYTVVDFDVDERNKPSEDQQRFYEQLSSYSEYSPSGRGVHVWIRANVPARKSKGIEVYSNRRPITVTKQVLNNVPIQPRQDVANAIVNSIRPEQSTGELSPSIKEPPTQPDATIVETIATKYPHLWNCDPNEQSDRSEVDFQLCKEIARVSRHKEQTFRVFMLSPRAKAFRPKAKGQDQYKCLNRPEYVKATIERAFASINWHAEELMRTGLGGKLAERLRPQVESVPLTPTQGPARLRIVDVLDIEIEAQTWLWNDWIPRGTLMTLGGRGGAGKSTLAYNFAAIVASGLTWPDGTQNLNPQNVLIWSNEDSKNCKIPSQCLESGYHRNSPGRIGVIDSVVDPTGERRFVPSRDIRLLREEAKKIGNVGLIVIDPLLTILAGNSNQAEDVTRSLGEFLALAEELQCSIVGLVHFNKARFYERVIDRINGSAAWTNVPRMNITVVSDGKARGVITRAKTNLAETGGGYSFYLHRKARADRKGVSYNVVWPEWDGGYITGSSEEIIAQYEVVNDNRRDKPSTVRNAAVEFLKEHLKDGSKERSLLLAMASKEGYSSSTIDRARRELGLISEEKQNERGFVTNVWKMP